MKTAKRTSIFSAICAALALNSAAASEPFEAQPGMDGVLITPELAYRSAQVTLSGPNGMETLEFATGETIFVPAPKLDGQFKYEVILSPALSQAQRDALSSSPRDGSAVPLFENDQTVYSGYMQVDGGVLVDGSLVESSTKSDTDNGNGLSAPADPGLSQVINNDATIRYSLCVGGDCADTESWGTDTVRLKENNLRIHFDDTSDAGSFPRNDWRLVANGSSGGDPEMFAIEDATAGNYVAWFAAGAPANSLYVSSEGRLGIKTNSPAVEMHALDGDTPTLRLDQNQSAGWPAQTWDLAGNEANFFVRDASHGSNLPFRIYPSANNHNSLIVDPQGQVGIGLPNNNNAAVPDAAATLHVRARDVANDSLMIIEDSNGTDVLTLTAAGDLVLEGTLAQLSREDSKEHFNPVDHAEILATLKALPISTWNYKHQADDERHLGPMAGAFYDAYRLGADPQHIATSDMAAVALASAQALIHEVEQRDERIQDLEERLARMEGLMVKVLESNTDLATQLVSR